MLALALLLSASVLLLRMDSAAHGADAASGLVASLRLSRPKALAFLDLILRAKVDSLQLRKILKAACAEQMDSIWGEGHLGRMNGSLLFNHFILFLRPLLFSIFA